jgi:hypothetical protein
MRRSHVCALLRLGMWVAVALGWAAVGIAAGAETVEPLAPPPDTTLPLTEGIPVTFTWRAVADAPGYRFQLATERTFRKPIVDRRVAETSTAVRDLPSGRYYWRCSADGTTWSTTRAFTLRVGAPDTSSVPPAGVQAPIRVMLVMPSEPDPLSPHVARFKESLKRSRGPLVSAATLSEADVIVQFTSYRRAVDGQGQTQDWWHGEYKVLQPSVRDTRLGPAIPERFALVVIDRISGDAESAVGLLARTLLRALRRESPSIDIAV